MANQTQIAYYKEMAKLDKQIKELKDCIHRNVAEIYACFTLVLYKDGWTADEIEELFVRTQEVWVENTGRMEKIIEWCEKETGIQLVPEDDVRNWREQTNGAEGEMR